MRRLALAALLVACQKSEPAPPEEHPAMGEAEQRRAAAICDGYVARVCACAEREPSLRDVVLEEHDLDRAADKLIAMANAAGGIDNITVVLARIEPP